MKKLNIFKKVLGVTTVFVLLFQTVSQAFAETSYSVTHTSISDFSAGTVPTTLDANVSEGDVELKQDLNTLTDTTKEDFSFGRSLSSYTYPTNNPDSSIVLDKSYSYDTTSTPALSDNVVYNTFYDSAHTILYVSTQVGETVINTQGTATISDDTQLFVYNSTSTPSIGSNRVSHALLDPSRNLLYLSTYGSGVKVINTQGTLTISDDVIAATYSTSSTPSIGGNNIYSTFFDSSRNLLYISLFSGGLSVINTQGTVSAADDTLVKTYTTGTTPAIGAGWIKNSYLDNSTNLLYVHSDGGLTVINTQGTVSAADDTLVKTYTTGTTPAIGSNYVRSSLLDNSRNLLYVVTEGGGLTVINTQGTVTAADDTLIVTYSHTTSPALPSNYIYNLFFDTNNNYLYLDTSRGLAVINTQGTMTQTDDILVKTYNAESPYRLGDSFTYHSFIEPSQNLLYVSTYGGGLSVENLNNSYIDSGQYIENSQKISDTPSRTLNRSEIKPNNTTVSVQYRVGTEDAVAVTEFDGSTPSEYLGDYFGWGDPFNTATEGGGTIKLSNPSPYANGNDSIVDTWIGIGSVPAGSKVTAKVRINSTTRENPPNYSNYIYADEGYGSSNETPLANNTWEYMTLITTNTITTLDFEIVWKTGTWNNSNDTFEIDWVKVEKPDASWGSWSTACTNKYGCPIDPTSLVGKTWIQYRLNLATTDTTQTPEVQSVTYASGYQTTGDYLSPVIDAGSEAAWDTLTPDITKPPGTSISFYTRSGNTSSPDGSWSDWLPFDASIDSPNTRYMQYKATLSTTDSNQTPVIHSVTIAYTGGLAPSTNTSSSSSSSQPETFQIPWSLGGNNIFSGAVTPIKDSNTGGQGITVIANSLTLPNNGFLSAINIKPSLLNSKKVKSNTVLAGGIILGIKTGGSLYWQIGNIQKIYYKAYTPQGSGNDPPIIIPSLQSNPSILSLSYKGSDLIPPGSPKYKFPAKSLKLAYSVDGINWKLLPGSVVDIVNHTVSMVQKIGGYYVIVSKP